MADNEHPPPSPPGPPPAPIERPGPVEPSAPPPAPSAPTEVTPEQVRQFQEFQQFQQLMRQQADQGSQQPPPGYLQPWGAPPKPPSMLRRFVTAVVGKIVTAAIVLLMVLVGGYLAIDYFFGSDNDEQTADKTGGRGPAGNHVYSTNPYEAVRQVYDYIGQNRDGEKDTNLVCLKFTEEAKAEFAANMGYADCDEAVRALSEEVEDPDAYAESMPSDSSTEVTDDTIRISSCETSYSGIQGGPPLGVFTVSKIKDSVDGQWIISGHETESCATTPTGSATPPSS